MELEVAVHTAEGSPGAQYALAALAHTLNINENALKTALNGAFDLLPMTAGFPMMALHLSFKQLSYHIDGKTLYQIMGAFRQVYGPALTAEGVHNATTQAVCSQLRGAPQRFAGPTRNEYIGSSWYPDPTFQPSNAPNSSTLSHQHSRACPPPSYTGYAGNVSGHASQPVVTSMGQSEPDFQSYQNHGLPGQGNEEPSFLLRDSCFERYR